MEESKRQENDWAWALQHCSTVRSFHQAINRTVPHSFTLREKENDVLFLAVAGELGQAALFSMSTSEDTMGKCSGLVNPQPQTQALSQAAILLRERMRKVGAGITGYDCLKDTGELLVHLGSSSLLCSGEGKIIKELDFGGAVDIKACPHSCHLLACVLDKDLWLMNADRGEKTRLTFSHTPQTNLLSAGQPSFVTQEEFDRFTGYWWQPAAYRYDGVSRILFEEVDETGVAELHTLNPSTQKLESYRYPLVDTKNATSVLRLLEITSDDAGKVTTKVKSLSYSFTDLWSDFEYLVRCGWLPDGKSVWVQLLDRSQQHLKLVMIPLDDFIGEGDSPSSSSSKCSLLLEENSSHWINVTDVLHFLTVNDGNIRFLWLSERSGYRHLEMGTVATGSSKDVSDMIQHCMVERKVLTSGDWVIKQDQIWVDEDGHLVYFMANVKTCLETHLHVVRWDTEGLVTDPTQLTLPDFSHDVTMDKSCNMFITTYSSLQTTPVSSLYRISHKDDLTVYSQHCCNIGPQTRLPPNFAPPKIFSFQLESGETLYGNIMKPTTLQPGEKCPTILNVYGGPHIQCVVNKFGYQLMKMHSMTSAGHVVVNIDNRGSYNRGINFEAHLQNKMGDVEVKDQVTGLLHIAQQEQCIDLSRIAVHGWSYGGYMSVMCLAQRPDIFKVAIAGAPVTMWEDYDTGYTERYLGRPTTNPTGYKESSVLAHAQKLPAEANRLLLIHGMNDENVFFKHTSQLVDCLVGMAKPYQLQVYCGERHGLRSYYSTRHYEATIMTFLKQHL